MASLSAPGRPAITESEPAAHYRPDIQGLRTVAVGAVVLFHLWPNRVSGGFVGVDVFFVISGFLITGHLFREAEATGTVRLLKFWARRIARLLPASFLVLFLTAVATLLLVPKDLWPSYFQQIRASALYFQNWQLAWDAVDYMAMGQQATAVQHFWSLSVEEQFYLFWPVLIVIGLAAAARIRRNANARTLLVALLTLVFSASLWFSVLETASRQSWAYFATFTRVWEFAAGGLVALAGVFVGKRLHGGHIGAAAAWVGLAMIALAAISFDGRTPFPGYVALLPVVGTALVLHFGNSASILSPRALLSMPPMVWTGGISYAIYLWHWAPIVILPLVTGHALILAEKLGIGVFTLVVAQVSTKYFETPLRKSRFFANPRNAVLFAGAGALLFSGITAAVNFYLAREEAQAAQYVEQRLQESCVGPSALDPSNDCGNPMGTGPYVVSPDVVALQNEEPPFSECQQDGSGREPIICVLGQDRKTATKKIALAGDSHATQWFPGFDEAGKKLGWSIDTYSKSGCPVSLAHRVLPTETTREKGDSCDEWNDKIISDIVASDVETVVLTSYQSAYSWESRAGDPAHTDPVDGFASVMEEIADSGKRVIVIKAVPRTNGEYVTRCLVDNGRDLERCGMPRKEALPPDLMEAAVKKLARPDVQLVSLDEQFCDETWCYPVVGDVVVYRDHSHISAEYARALMPWLETAIED